MGVPFFGKEQIEICHYKVVEFYKGKRRYGSLKTKSEIERFKKSNQFLNPRPEFKYTIEKLEKPQERRRTPIYF